VTRNLVIAAAAVCFAANLRAAEDIVTVKSPDGRIEFRMFDGTPWEKDLPHPHLVYSVSFNGKPLSSNVPSWASNATGPHVIFELA